MKSEKTMLEFSALGGLFFAIFGVVWGIITKSSMIKFDGLYASVSLILSVISIFVTNYISTKDYDKFPFGKGVLEPITVSVKSMILIVMCSITFYDAVKVVLSGGSQSNTDLALGYSLVSTIVCSFVYKILSKNSKKISSDILKAESSQWLMDTMLSVAVLIGFIISIILEHTQLNGLSVYVDSFMVIITSGMFIKVPVMALVDSFKEISNSNADSDINQEIDLIVKDIQKKYKFEDSITRVSKVGRQLRIEIDFVFNDDSKLYDINEMDDVREVIYSKMKNIKLEKWLNVNFTGDRKWAV